MVQTAEVIFRDYTTDGISASGRHEPRKVEIREWGTWLEGFANALGANGGLVYTTKALLDADLAHPANTSAWVIGDSTAANNGIYRKSGGSGSGSWTRVADLPYSFIKASDTGAGTPNAIQATTSIPVPSADGAALIALNIFEDNTASPVTVSFNGGTALTIKTNTGNDVAAGGLVAGMIVAGYKSGSTLRLLSDQVSAAIVAAAEAAADRAEAAEDSIAGLLAGVTPVFASRATAAAYAPTAAPAFINTAGFYAAGDGGGALYKTVGSEPAHDGKFSITLDDAVTVVWYELAETTFLNVRQFGAAASQTSATNAAAFLSVVEYCRAKGVDGFAVTADADGEYEVAAGVNLSDDTNLYNGLRVMGIGRPHLKMIGSGEGFKIVNSALSNEYRWHLENFIIEGSATITDALVIGNMNHSTFKAIETRECTNAGIKTFNTVCNHWEQCTGGNGNFAAQAVTPAYCWLRENDYDSSYIQCKGEGALFFPKTYSYVPGDVNAGADTITVTGHVFKTGHFVQLSTDNSNPGGTGGDFVYYVIVVDANTIKLATTWANANAGTAINLTSGGAGNHTITVLTTGVGYINSDWSSDYNGTYEGVHCGANVLDTGNSHIGFYGTDFEGNSHYDVILNGMAHRLDKIQSISGALTLVHNILILDAVTPLITGGFIRNIHCDTSALPTYSGVVTSDNVGIGFTGSGDYRSYGCTQVNTSSVRTGVEVDRFNGFYAQSPASDGGSSAARIDSGWGMLLNFRADGVMYSPPVYSQTTGGAANVFVGTDGLLARSTSALKYKKVKGSISDDTVDKAMALRGFHYTDRADPKGRSYIGLAADDAHDAGLTDLVSYNDDGEVEGLMYERFVPILIQKIASLEQRIIELEAR